MREALLRRESRAAGHEAWLQHATDPGEEHDLSDSLTTDLQALRKILAAFP